MSTLVDRPPGRARQLLPSPWAAGPIAAVQAAAGSLVALLVPVVATWVVASGGRSEWTLVVRAGFCAWLLAQHAGLAVDGGTVGLVPLGLTAVPLASSWYAGRRLARVLDPDAERIAAGAPRSGRGAAAGPPWTGLAAMTLGYGLIGAGVGWLARVDGVQPVLWQCLAGPSVVCAVGGGLGAAAHRYGSFRGGLAGLRRRLPGTVRGWLNPAAAALATHLAAAALVLTVAVLLGGPRAVALQQALGGGVFAAVLVTLAQAALVPNLLVWAGAWLAGPGFAVGAGTSVTPQGTVLGPLPALPVLGALPAPGPMPPAVIGVLLMPVLAGMVAGWLLQRAGRPTARRSLLAEVRDLAGTAVTAGLGLGLLGWLSAGPAGPGRLSDVGPATTLAAAAQLGAVFAGQVLLGGALAAVASRLRARLPR